jgi:Kef-type K+ transport system membrane component KefB
MSNQLLLIVIICTGAAVIPFISRMIRVPSAACEILFGLVLFNTFVTAMPEWFEVVSELGFIYLMFIAGMESDLGRLMKNRRELLAYVCIVALSLAITPLLFMACGLSWYLGLSVAVISEAILIAVLRETGAGKKPIGRHIIGIAVTGELLSIALLTGIEVYHHHGLSAGAGLQALKLVVLLAGAIFFLKLLYISAWWNPRRVEQVMKSDDPVEEGIRVLVAIACTGALLAYAAGVEAILGSFMAGIVFGNVFKSKGRFEEKIHAVGFGFLAPLFFVSVGARIHLGQLIEWHTVGLALLLTLMIFVSNLFPLLFARFLRFTLREALCLSLILSSPLTMIIVAGTIGEKMGFITPDTLSTLVLTALISSLLYPALFKYFSRTLP